MSLWGRDFKLVGEMFDMPRVWEEMASNLVTHAIPHCGHLAHEEKPEERFLIAIGPSSLRGSRSEDD
jgi:haloacetate dehalogenase